jgi:Family of unknown function (DUF6282)
MKTKSVALAILTSAFAFTLALVAQQQPSSPLAGVIDFHAHTGPDATGRSINDFDLVRLARRAGMRGIVLKNHFMSTADRAQLAMEETGGIEVFGGVVLNRAIGGLNAEAIQTMLKVDGHRGKIVWMPTFDAENQVKFSKEHRPFVSVVKDGKPVPELAEIFQIIAQNDLILETGHSSADESLILIDAAKKTGVKKIVVTHAMADPCSAKDEQLKQMADMGAVIECVFLNTIEGPNAQTASGRAHAQITIKDYARVIKLFGAEHFLIASDLGQQFNPVHPDGMLAFINGLRAEGLGEREIDLVARKNPARLLGLE